MLNKHYVMLCYVLYNNIPIGSITPLYKIRCVGVAFFFQEKKSFPVGVTRSDCREATLNA